MSEVGFIPVKFEVTAESLKLTQKLSRVDPMVKKELHRYFHKLYTVGARVTSMRAPKDKGTLKASFFIGRQASASYADSEGFAVGTRLKYAYFQDNAERWHADGILGKTRWWPNVDTLSEWVARKINPAPEDLDHVTYFVGKHIAEHGVPAHNFMLAGEMAVKAAMRKEGPILMKHFVAGISK